MTTLQKQVLKRKILRFIFAPEPCVLMNLRCTREFRNMMRAKRKERNKVVKTFYQRVTEVSEN